MSEVLDVLNGLPVIEMGDADSPYMLVENNAENISKLKSVGVTEETAEKYGDSEYFCVYALAFSEGLAEDMRDGNFV